MYWYIKYPLLVILIVALLGIFGSIFRSCMRNRPAGEGEAPPVENSVPSGGSGAEPAAVEPVPSSSQVSSAVPSGGSVSPAVEEKLRMARGQLERGMLEMARNLAWKALESPDVAEFSPTWEEAVAIIDEADKRLMNSSAPATEKRGHRVSKGESLERIARRYYTNQLALKRINENLRRDGDNPIIRPSQTIMYISGAWSIRVSKQHFKLLLYLDGKLYRCWTIGIGRDNRTPVGTFFITGALAEPAWTPPGKSIPYGDPENVLGTRWLKLTPAEGTDPTLEGYGIHGTWEPDSVGTSCSAGCVRMRNEDVEELYDFIPPPGGSAPPVRVVIED